MLTYDLVQSKYDEALFFDQKRSLYVIVYVDDIKMFAPNHRIIDDLANYLQSIYEMTDLGEVKWYLRMEITRLPSQQKDAKPTDEKSTNEAILLTQAKYIRDLLARHEMEECAPIATPMTEIKLRKHPDPNYKCPAKELKQYQMLLGELMHLMVQTRPDIAFAVSKLAQFMSNSTPDHWTALKRVLRYLNGTKELEILYNALGSIVLKAWIDSSWDEDPDDDRSTHGHILFMGGGPIGWRSFKQSFVALSSTEVEYMGQASAATNVMWARGILQEMNIAGIVPEDKNDQMNGQTGYKNGQTGHIEDGQIGQIGDKIQNPIIIYADNQGAIKLANNLVFQKRTKHIAVKYHYTRDLINQGQIRLEYRPTAEMIADGLTKPLGPVNFKKFVGQLGMTSKFE